MRTYELTFVLDPRLPDEETQALCGEYEQMIAGAGGRVEHREDWGKRQLAYPIGKLEEGRYFLWHLSCGDNNPTQEVEHRMRQKEEVLRFLTVRTEKLDFDAAAAKSTADGEAAKAAGAEPAREETPAATPPKETAAAAPETPAPVETSEPQTTVATEDHAGVAPTDIDSDAVGVAAAEAEEADAASGEDEPASEEETR